MRKSLPAIACLALLAGCAAPRRQTYSQPPAPTPPAWTTGSAAPDVQTAAGARPRPISNGRSSSRIANCAR